MFLDQPDKLSAQRNKQKHQHEEYPSVVVLDEGQVGVGDVPSIRYPRSRLIAAANVILICSVTATVREPIHHSLLRLMQKKHGEI